MGMFFHNHFQMANGRFRVFVVRDDPVWASYKQPSTRGFDYRPWLLSAPSAAQCGTPENEFILGAEFPVGTEIPAEDWESDPGADVMLTALKFGFLVRHTGVYW